MSANGLKGMGRGITFLRGLIGHNGDECIPWPYGKDLRGYGQCPHEGKVRRAHRVMCELEYGPPPTPQHHAAHNCGCGAQGCVNPRHLGWKTATENQLDRRTHGTHGNGGGRRKKLTPVDVLQIRRAKGVLTQRKLAEIYDVSDASIRGIQTNRYWRGV